MSSFAFDGPEPIQPQSRSAEDFPSPSSSTHSLTPLLPFPVPSSSTTMATATITVTRTQTEVMTEDKKLFDADAPTVPPLVSVQVIPPTRPPIDWSSPITVLASTWRRFASLWTRRFVACLLAGQLVSLCITCTNVTTTELVIRNWALPTTQTFFLYLSLFLIYTPYTIYQYGLKGWGEMVLRDGWKYIILAACDVEGNFLVVKAYQYTSLLSCMLLDAWAIPVCLFFSWLYMRPKYHYTQIIGILICIGGLGMLVASDELTDKNFPAVNVVKGDIFMIVGATLYGFTNATEEFFVRRSPLYEVIGQLGMWGTLINGIQAAALEHKGMREATWNGATIGFLVAYTVSMITLYTVAPILYRLASSAYYNVSLLSSDFYGLLFGLFLFHYKPYWLYFPAFFVVILGLIIYFWTATPEQQGSIEPRAPRYVVSRSERIEIAKQDQDQDQESGGAGVEEDGPGLVRKASDSDATV